MNLYHVYMQGPLVSNLEEAAERAWAPLAHGAAACGHAATEAAALHAISLEDLQAWAAEHVARAGDARRALAVALHGAQWARSATADGRDQCTGGGLVVSGPREGVAAGSGNAGPHQPGSSRGGCWQDIQDVRAWQLSLPTLQGTLELPQRAARRK
jgi:hypothetical protein